MRWRWRLTRTDCDHGFSGTEHHVQGHVVALNPKKHVLSAWATGVHSNFMSCVVCGKYCSKSAGVKDCWGPQQNFQVQQLAVRTVCVLAEAHGMHIHGYGVQLQMTIQWQGPFADANRVVGAMASSKGLGHLKVC